MLELQKGRREGKRYEEKQWVPLEICWHVRKVGKWKVMRIEGMIVDVYAL